MSTIDRVSDLLEAYSAIGSPLMLTKLAEKMSAPKSTCFQFVQALKRREHLYSLENRAGFSPTPHLLSHAEIIAANDLEASRLDCAIASLRDSVNETANTLETFS